MNKRLYVKVFGDMAAYLGMFSNDFTYNDDTLHELMDGAQLHCLYLIQDFPEGCQANCAFCTQGRNSRNEKKESYLINNFLIKYPLKKIIGMIQDGFLEKRKIHRICFSAVYNEKTNENLLDIFKMIRAVTDVPLTACCIPDSKEVLSSIKEAGADRVVINYETSTEYLFEKLRGKYRNDSPYTWEKVNRSIDDALEIFGPSNVGSHLLIGVGETQLEALGFIQQLLDKKIRVSLFAFRPVPHTDLESHPQISHADYHKVQLGRYLMFTQRTRFENMHFGEDGSIADYGVDRATVEQVIASGKPFINFGGCPHCNRVHYDNNAKERYYNFPRPLQSGEIDIIKNEILG